MSHVLVVSYVKDPADNVQGDDHEHVFIDLIRAQAFQGTIGSRGLDGEREKNNEKLSKSFSALPYLPYKRCACQHEVLDEDEDEKDALNKEGGMLLNGMTRNVDAFLVVFPLFLNWNNADVDQGRRKNIHNCDEPC